MDGSHVLVRGGSAMLLLGHDETAKPSSVGAPSRRRAQASRHANQQTPAPASLRPGTAPHWTGPDEER